jgi:hypothetical protein
MNEMFNEFLRKVEQERARRQRQGRGRYGQRQNQGNFSGDPGRDNEFYFNEFVKDFEANREEYEEAKKRERKRREEEYERYFREQRTREENLRREVKEKLEKVEESVEVFKKTAQKDGVIKGVYHGLKNFFGDK